MSVTGHKSVQSLTIYQRVQEPKKLEMGNVLHTSLMTPDALLAVTAKDTNPNMRAIEQAPAPSNISKITKNKDEQPKEDAIIPFEPNFDEHDDVPDFDLLSYIADIQNEELHPIEPKSKQTTNTLTSNTMNQRNSPMFA